ncbi:hypothetical protein N0V93_003253 [Gnomoniopsis smithogilvyi]|uniref:Cytochrome P450 n=1 Tax=Gnomoniopsis smithogilvyi TaxID=1191159 RepID=A0A9W8YYA8_9PEZI|nr:hypothetical protein N0V93_003253 [Gnomoniopsis smithogilvyi]
MALASLIAPAAFPLQLACEFQTLFILISALLLTIGVYRNFLHPLSQIPGPCSLRLSSLPLLWRSYAGTEATFLTRLFAETNAPILRIGPNEVLLADGVALAPIYSTDGGFPKAACYRNFDIDGFPSLFSALDKGYRAPRAKSVVPMFATAALRKGESSVRSVAARLVERLEGEKRKGGRVDVLDLARSTAKLRRLGDWGRKGAKDGSKLSASEFVNAFVGVGRFFFLPNWAFMMLDKVAGYLFETPETLESFDSVQVFVEDLVNEADVEDGTYQARMLKLGLSKKEVAAQMKDLVFAGTDSSGMNLSTFCWQLAKHADIFAKVTAEVRQAKNDNAEYDPSTLPYLRACLRETLRLSMANPTRLPRVVPEGGWIYTPSADFSFTGQILQVSKSYFLPAGTLVSLQIHTLHHNPAVFPDPYEFRPERWLDSPPDQLEKMSRNYIPFGLGSRQCIARNLAMMELNRSCAAILESDVLDGARNVGDRIEILEWFNSKVRGERIEIEFQHNQSD